MKNKLYILCDHGLGNRIGCLVGGIKSAQLMNMEPIICWPMNNWCHCDFYDLFNFNITVADNEFSLMLAAQIHELELPYFFISTFDGTISKDIHGHTLETLQLIASLKKDAIYANCKTPKHYVSKKEVADILSSMTINPDILIRVKEYCNQNNINASVIGLHLRKTDTGSLANEEEIYQLVSNSKEVRYFLCSDNKETEDRFVALGNVMVYPKVSSVTKLIEGDWRDSVVDNTGRYSLFNVNRPKQQIIEAFVDLLILSRTQVQRQSKSTFRAIAERYSGIDIL